MASKVRIDLATGILEVEGTEEFVRELYKDFRERFGTGQVRAPAAPPATIVPPPAAAGSGTRTERKAGQPKTGSVKSRSPVLVKDLDLATKGERVGLKTFLTRFRKLNGAQEHNALFVYYLSRVAAVPVITIDHVYTCYKGAGVRPPTLLPQSLWDTARRKGTIDTTSIDDIKLTLTGENWVDHDLEKAAPGASA